MRDEFNPANLPKGNERIMFVDDEPDMVLSIVPLLEHLGYRIKAFLNAEEALDAFKHEPESVDLIVTDHGLEMMNGLELAERVHEIRPEIPIVLISGFHEDLTPDNLRRVGIQEMLTKPAGLPEWANTVRRALDMGYPDH